MVRKTVSLSAMTQPFTGKTALVTGAASGIGKAVAEHLATNGAARLVLIDRDAAALDTLTLDCPTDRVAGDVSDEALWDRIDLANLDLAVVNAGVAGASPIATHDYAEWRRILGINLDGAFLTLRASLRAIRDGGAIVTIASASGIKPEPGVAAYGASKAALIHLTKVAAKEAAPRHIRVNAIAPGFFVTDQNRALLFDEQGQPTARTGKIMAATPMGRFGEPEELIGALLYLVSPEAARFVTGIVLPVELVERESTRRLPCQTL